MTKLKLFTLESFVDDLMKKAKLLPWERDLAAEFIANDVQVKCKGCGREIKDKSVATFLDWRKCVECADKASKDER